MTDILRRGSGHVPKLRPLDIRWVAHNGDPHLVVRDTMALSGNILLIPAPLAPVLSLCDGTRDVPSIQVALELRYGLGLTTSQIQDMVNQLGEALFLDDERFAQARDRALAEYRSAPHRRPALAGEVYPQEPDQLRETIQSYCEALPETRATSKDESASIVGLISPHIDYQRGWRVYARLWHEAADALEDVELAIIFGTDHAGSSRQVTLTRQSYATPWGILPTDMEIVDALARIIGSERAFAEEIHHIREHSIELAAVWLHHFLGGRQCPLVPILCGSFDPFIRGGEEPGDYYAPVLEALKEATKGRKTLVIAAGDLAHVGPTFGDQTPLNPLSRTALGAVDQEMMAAISAGGASAFLEKVRDSGDRYRICGMPPIYLALQLLGDVKAEVVDYAQCPADNEGDSVVSIAGVLLYRG